MANIIKPKRSNTASAVPTTGQLASGELAVNMADQKVYINNGTSVVQVGAGNLTGLGDVNITSVSNNQVLKYDSATSKWINGTGGGGSGDVTGPASSTDNAISRFDGTTGKLIQNSVVTVDDNGNMAGVNSITTPDYITFDTTANETSATGKLFWDDGDGVLSNGLKGGNVTLQIGTQQYARVYNDTASTLTKGQVVYIYGAQGNRLAVRLARADVESTSFGTIGLVAESIASGAEGFIITSGALYKLNTSTLTAGATVYLSPTTAGAVTTTKPQAPNQLVVLGWVERVDNTVGSIYVKIDNGYELDELHDVQITSPQSGNIIIYDASTTPIGVWKNAFLTAGTGISISNGNGSVTVTNSGVTSAVAGTGISVSGATGAVTITNSAPDQTVTLTNGGSIGITGTYPSFTLTNNGVTSFSAGTTGLTPSTGTTGAVTLAGTLAITNGGTGATDAGTARSNLGLAIGTNVQAYDADLAAIAALAPTADNFIVGNGTTWVLETPAQSRTSLGGTTVGQNLFTLTNPSAITFPRFNADNTVSALNATDFRTAIGAGTGSGTVTSVTGTSPVASSGGTTPAISLSAAYGDTLNPYGSKTANQFLAAPNGTAGAPSFRAIVAADIPTLNQNTTGTASNVTGTVAIANGGTGATTAANALTNLGAYPSSNPSGYTSNTGTVTSVAAGAGMNFTTITGTGTVTMGTPGTLTTSTTNSASGTTHTHAVTFPVTSVNGQTGAVTVSSGPAWQAVQATGFTAAVNSAYPVNTTSAAITVTFPASASAGNEITLVDYAGTWDTNGVTLNPNGLRINGLTSNQVLQKTERGGITFVYIDTTQGWIAYSGYSVNPAVLPLTLSVDLLLVGGGGGGGGAYVATRGAGGGGGAGGFRSLTAQSFSANTNYTVTVGAGGSGVATATTNGSPGNASVFGSLSAAGGGFGGGGGKASPNTNGGNGGSGGGAGLNTSSGGTGGTGNTPTTTPSQGSNGGNSTYAGGGGGGASAAGGTGIQDVGGNGGNGSSSSLSGVSTVYAGGGGGGDYLGTPGTGGSGGGANAGNNNGTVNTGGGGGGAVPATLNTGSGGSGIVIAKYPAGYTIANPGGGLTFSTSSDGINKTTTFTAGTGTIQFT